MARILSSFLRVAQSLAHAAVVSIAAVSVAHAGGPSDQPVRTVPAAATVTDRYIVRFRDASAEPSGKLAAIGARNGKAFAYVRAMSGGAHVVRITRGMPTLAAAAAAGRTPEQAARVVAAELSADPDIQYIEPDAIKVPLLVPNDPYYGGSQWDLYEAAGGINMPAAWDITTGSTAVTIAVIDTGYRPHADLAAKILPGYDFISDPTVSNDGDGRDADASDPGDYGCSGSSSSWHGTHVSGTLAAITNNGAGIAGINWVSKILPARVLGVCGGYTSDIVDAMRWAAGIAVPNVPANPTPARVQNLSLGGSGTCEAAFQSAINDVVALGTVVVVAAGNSNQDAANTSPASCSGVIAVGATTRQGGRSSYSNYGAKVALSAPGDGILSTLNAGHTAPGADSYASYSGTSMATPHVAGVASLLLSQNPSMTPAQVKSVLQSTARAFPTGTGNDCTTALCGAGIVNAAAALAAAATTMRVNVAAATNGAVASASSTYSNAFPIAAINDGDRTGANWESGGGWNDATNNAWPDWVRIDFPQAQSVSEIDVFTIQDNYRSPVAPTESMTFSQYGITAFDVQYWNGSTWVTVPNGSVTGNNKVWSKFAFPAVTTTAIRVQVDASLAGYSRIIEVEAYGGSAAVNAALASNGGVAVASSTYSSGYPPSGVNNGDRRGLNWESGGGWNDATAGAFPDQIQVNFSATKSINEIDVFTVQDNYRNPSEPTPTMTFTQYGITDFDVQYWSGSTWVTVPGGSVSGNNLVWRRFTFPAVSTNAVRVNVRNALSSYSRVTEIEAYVAQ